LCKGDNRRISHGAATALVRAGFLDFVPEMVGGVGGKINLKLAFGIWEYGMGIWQLAPVLEEVQFEYSYYLFPDMISDFQIDLV
jgi:hypothetical protein